jgi:hypothetical protein
VNPFFSITFGTCCSFTVAEDDTRGFHVHVQVWRLVLEFWITWASKKRVRP